MAFKPVMRGGKERQPTRVNTCWLSGVELDLRNDPQRHRSPTAFTMEHIVPQVSHLFALLTPEMHDRNTRPAAGYVNAAVGCLPLAIKFDIRDDLLALGLSRTTKGWRGKVLDVVKHHDYRYRLLGKKVYHDPVVWPPEQIRLWSVDNPHHPVTHEVLVTRMVLLDDLREQSLKRFGEWFGVGVTQAMREAFERDLFVHHGDNGRTQRRKLADAAGIEPAQPLRASAD